MKKELNKGEVRYYFLGFLLVSVLNVCARFISTIFLSSHYGVEYKVELVMNFLPVLSFSEPNIILFRTISSLSLIIPAVMMFLLFLQRYLRSNSKVAWKRDASLNIWIVGLYLTFIQYGIALILDERIQFANDWRGGLLVFGLVVWATKMNIKNLDTKKPKL